jgi:hypothetical protein
MEANFGDIHSINEYCSSSWLNHAEQSKKQLQSIQILETTRCIVSKIDTQMIFQLQFSHKHQSFLEDSVK